MGVRVAGCFLLLAMSGLVWSSFGVFLVPLQNEFSSGRGGISAAFSLFALTNAVSAPFVGHAMRRWDSRRVLALLSVIFGGSLVATAFIGSTAAYWFVFGILGGFGAQSVSSFAVFAILARRAGQRPASAMSLADAGSGLATLLGLPLVQAVIDAFGWRVAYGMLGVIVLLAGTALHLLLLDPVRRPLARRSRRGAPRSSSGTTAVYFLAISFFCGSAAYHGLMTQQIALLHDNGTAASTAVWYAAAAGGSVFVWRLLSGYLVDVVGPNRVMSIAFIAIVATFIGLILALSAQSIGALLVYPLVMGIGFGGQQVVLAISLRRIVPPADFAVQFSYCRLASGLGMAAGPVAAGYISDAAGVPSPTVAMLGALAAFHCLLYASAMRLAPEQK